MRKAVAWVLVFVVAGCAGCAKNIPLATLPLDYDTTRFHDFALLPQSEEDLRLKEEYSEHLEWWEQTKLTEYAYILCAEYQKIREGISVDEHGSVITQEYEKSIYTYRSAIPEFSEEEKKSSTYCGNVYSACSMVDTCVILAKTQGENNRTAHAKRKTPTWTSEDVERVNNEMQKRLDSLDRDLCLLLQYFEWDALSTTPNP